MAMTFGVRQAKNNGVWWDSSLPKNQEYDLSDHNPCEWQLDDLRGISYNVQFLPGLIATTTGKSRTKDIKRAAERIVNWLTSQKPEYDVVCLQEVFDSNASMIIEQQMKAKGYKMTTPLGGAILGTSTGAGVRTFVREAPLMKCEDVGGHIYRNKVDYLRRGDAMTDKGVKHVQVTKNNQRYHILNTHLQASYNDPSHQYYVEVAMAQLIELRDYIEQQRHLGRIKSEDQIVLCGDFNIPKNAIGANLDSVSKRGDTLMKRAKHLLGDGFHLSESALDATVPYSFDANQNTYLNGALGDGAHETMCANLDLVFTVDAKPTPSSSSDRMLGELICQLQVEVARFVQSKLWMLSLNGFYQLSSDNQNTIDSISKAIDQLIETPNDAKVCASILDFSKRLSLRKQFKIEFLLTSVLLSQCQLSESVKQQCNRLALLVLSDQIEPDFLPILRNKWTSLRQLILKGDINHSDLIKMTFSKEEVVSILRKEVAILKTKLKRFSNKNTEKAIQKLFDELQSHIDHYNNGIVQDNKTDVHVALIAGCTRSIETLGQHPDLKKNTMFKRFLSHFLIKLGTLLAWFSDSYASNLKNRGANLLGPSKHLERFNAIVQLAPDHAEKRDQHERDLGVK